MSETRLYAAVKTFLEAQGFSAKGEIGGCDVVAVRPGEPPILVICELKLGLNLELLLQAADRMAMADAVWLAVPRTRRGRDRDRRMVKLCRLIGFGLMTVGAEGIIEVLAEPEPYRPPIEHDPPGKITPRTWPAPGRPDPRRVGTAGDHDGVPAAGDRLCGGARRGEREHAGVETGDAGCAGHPAAERVWLV